MHILLGLLGIIAAAAFWYYRMKAAGEAASEVVDAAQRARGAWNRRKFRTKAQGSVLTAVNDPAVGAVIMIVSTCLERGPLSAATQAAIKDTIRTITGTSDPDDLLSYATWTAEQVPSPNDVSLKLGTLWRERLTHEQRVEFLAILTRIAGMEGPLLQPQAFAVQKLRERLAIA